MALFGGGAIRRYRPDGTLDAVIRAPRDEPDEPGVRRRRLDELYVTSARHRLSAEQLAREPLAGSVLRLRPGVRSRDSDSSANSLGVLMDSSTQTGNGR